MNFERLLTYQKRDPAVNIVNGWINKSSRPVPKTHVISESPFLLEYYQFFPNLQI